MLEYMVPVPSINWFWNKQKDISHIGKIPWKRWHLRYALKMMAQTVRSLPVMQETWVWCLGQEDPWEKGMDTHFSILVWRIPWTEEPGRLQSVGVRKSLTRLSDYITSSWRLAGRYSFWPLLMPMSEAFSISFIL